MYTGRGEGWTPLFVLGEVILPFIIMDQLIEVKLLNPHDHNFKYKRPDGSMYKVLIRHNKEPVTEEVIDYDGPLYSKHPDL
jgi:hypothetical protein